MNAAHRHGWGIVGTGRMAATMAATLAACPDASLRAVAGRDTARTQQFALTHAIPHPCDMAAMLARADIDIVYIATPPPAHLAACLAAFAAGKHVLCEKPLATTAADASAIAAAAAQSGRFCMEALWTHCVPALAETARLLAANAIGTRLHLQASFGLPTDQADPVFQPGGGALLDRGCYPISLALRLFGDPAQITGSITRNANGVDTDATLLIDFTDGNTAAIATSLTAYLANDLVISGTTGRLTLHEPITRPTQLSIATAHPTPPHRRTSAIRRLARTVPLLATIARLRDTRAVPARGDGYGHQIDEVHRCLAAGHVQSPTIPLSLSIATLAVIDDLNAQDPGSLVAVDGFEPPTKGL